MMIKKIYKKKKSKKKLIHAYIFYINKIMRKFYYKRIYKFIYA